MMAVHGANIASEYCDFTKNLMLRTTYKYLKKMLKEKKSIILII